MSKNRAIPPLNLSGVQRQSDKSNSGMQGGFKSRRKSYPQPDNYRSSRRTSGTFDVVQVKQRTNINPHEYILQKLGILDDGQYTRSQQEASRVKNPHKDLLQKIGSMESKLFKEMQNYGEYFEVKNFKSNLQEMVQRCRDHRQMCENKENIFIYKLQEQIKGILGEEEISYMQALLESSNKNLLDLQQRYDIIQDRIHHQFQGQTCCVKVEEQEEFRQFMIQCLQMQNLDRIKYKHIVEFADSTIETYRKEQKLSERTQKVQDDYFRFKITMEREVFLNEQG
eukprot:TRINITY_DN650_c0_g2_i1.p1 TRINITY_DN650_c0_g2~~TRINITY_DN650_c0_g2_i1.p1  ORF type:complete len:282 (+),score=23.80 TRINITY_DN650_c0_g2_i1:96-941(+)